MNNPARSISILVAILVLPLPAIAAEGDTNQLDGFRDTPMLPSGKWHVHDPDRPSPPVVTPGATFSQAAPPPSDAEVIFDGTDLSKWLNNKGEPATWKVENGYM